MEDTIKAHVQKFFETRKNPVLLLKIDELLPFHAFDVQTELGDRKFASLDVILHTPGGDIGAAYGIVQLLKARAQELNIFVPYYAKSAGTLICLAANKIYLAELAELGPLDTQINEERDGSPETYISALNGFKALEQVQIHSLETLDAATALMYRRSGLKMAEAIHLAAEFTGRTSGQLYTKLDPMKIGEYARALDVGERYGVKVLRKYRGWSAEDAKKTMGRLVKGYPDHGYIIDAHELKILNLPHGRVRGELIHVCCGLRDEMLAQKGDRIELVADMPETPEANGGWRNAG